jgi:hypothetical protein
MRCEAIKRTLLDNAERLRQPHQRIHTTLEYRSRSPPDRARWTAACAAFHGRYDTLAFPGGASDALVRIVRGDADAIENGLCCVECRPFFFRSGYMFKDIFRKLKRALLSDARAARFAVVVAAHEKYRDARRNTALRLDAEN